MKYAIERRETAAKRRQAHAKTQLTDAREIRAILNLNHARPGPTALAHWLVNEKAQALQLANEEVEREEIDAEIEALKEKTR